MNALPQVEIYTDGSCSPNPGPGGWAALLRYQDIERELSGCEVETTNNRMELTAAVQALQSLKKPCRIVIYTDSEYLRRGITEWLPGWRKRNWRRKTGTLANIDLWQALDVLLKDHEIEWRWVRGHAGNKYNERVDLLAKKAIPRRQ